MKRFVVLAMLLVVVSMSSCIKWKCCINGDFVQVYKTKGDYTNNAYVLYNKDKDYIYGYYDDVDTTLFPMPLYGGYYLHHEMSSDAILSLSFLVPPTTTIFMTTIAAIRWASIRPTSTNLSRKVI